MDVDEVASILNFYSARDDQNGNGLDYFYTPYSMQKGSGIGSFLAGVSRPIIPLIRQGVAYLAPHLLQILHQLAGDFAVNPTLSSLQSSLKTHGVNTLENVTNEAISKMRGGRLGMTKNSILARTSFTPRLATPRKRNTIKGRVVKKKTSVNTKTLKKKPKPIQYPFFK